MSRETKGPNEIYLDAPVSALSPGVRAHNDICETNGRRANHHKVYHVSITGEDCYDLLDLLRKLALESTTYQTVARAVVCERMIYDQVREQGF